MGFVHTCENGVDFVRGPSLDVAISRTGAELFGLTWKPVGKTPVDILWRNNQIEPPADGFWRRHAPILFPIVGGIHDNKSVTSSGDAVHFGGLHGFVRSSLVDLVSAGPVERGFALNYSFAADSVTLDMFPWKFAISISYTILDDGIEQVITVANLDGREMPYQVGWHPGINVPLSSGLKKDCHLRLPGGRVVRLLNDENCHLTGDRVEIAPAGDFPFNERDLELTYMFDVSAVDPSDRVVEILDPDCRTGVRVSFPDYPHLGIWSDAGAPFVCVEPWQGMDDSVVQEPFDRKFGIVNLKPGRSETRTAAIRVFEKG